MRIFNQLRKLQVQRQQVKNYFIYALGEIVLIVFGILIALQINNWNQGRNENRQRVDALEILQQTFQANGTEIDRALTEFDRLLNITNTRIENSGPEISVVSDSLIAVVREIDLVNLNLVRGTDVSGRDLSLISSEVRNLLLEYSAAHEVYKQQEQNVTSLSLKLEGKPSTIRLTTYPGNLRGGLHDR